MIMKIFIRFVVLLALLVFTQAQAGDADADRMLSMFHISDLHINSSYAMPEWPAGRYGFDPPEILIDSAFNYMHKMEAQPDFIIWTGDSSRHFGSSKKDHTEKVFDNLKDIVKKLNSLFPDAIVIPALGNHDTDPADQYPDFKMTNNTLDFYEKYIDNGSLGDLLEGEARETFKKCGYYSYSVEKKGAKLKFIVLNTNLYYSNKYPLDLKDPCGQFKWLEDELATRTREQEQVFFVGHIPPGFFERNTKNPFFNVPNFDYYNEEFVRIFSDTGFSKQIVAHFYGHTHTDSFRLFTNFRRKFKGVAFIAPSISPFLWDKEKPLGVNPSVRLYHYNATGRMIQDYQQHYLNLEKTRALADDHMTTTTMLPPVTGTDRSLRNSKFLGDGRRKRDLPDEVDETTMSNDDVITTTNVPDNATTTSQGESEITTLQEEEQKENATFLDKLVDLWQFGYNATDAFKIPNLSLINMRIAYQNMIQDDPHHGRKIFNNFYKHNTVYRVTQDNMNCTLDCHIMMLCAVVEFTRTDMHDCLLNAGMPLNSSVLATTTNSHEDPVPISTEAKSEETTTTSDTTTSTVRPAKSTTAKPAYVPALSDNQSQQDDDEQPKVTSVPENHSLRGVAIGFSIVMVIAIAVGGLYLYKRVQRNRYRNQEFLLNDSVFRYNGYSQVGTP